LFQQIEILLQQKEKKTTIKQKTKTHINPRTLSIPNSADWLEMRQNLPSNFGLEI